MIQIQGEILKELWVWDREVLGELEKRVRKAKKDRKFVGGGVSLKNKWTGNICYGISSIACRINLMSTGSKELV
jgi:hypothetical protein